MTDKKKHTFPGDDDFLLNEDFIRWRLFRTVEADDYWNNFLSQYPKMEKGLKKSIAQFDTININRFVLSGKEKEEIYHTVLHEVKRYRKRRLSVWIGSAAAIFLAGILSIVFFLHEKRDAQQQASWEKALVVGRTLPEEEIHLISSGEKTTVLPQSHIGLSKDGKAVITDSTNSKKTVSLSKKELNTLVVPYGKRSNVTLSDGTEVWLNSGTRFVFPSEFPKTKREVHVDGEIFIDVAHDPESPFIVHAQDIHIIVHGTSFNIKAYQDDTKRTVVLVEGKVEIETDFHQTIELSPNEKIDVAGRDISRETVDVSEFISWKNGILVLKKTPLSDILKQIGRYYNVQFEKTSNVELGGLTYSGKLFLSESLDSVMTSVSRFSSTVYQRENNIIRIRKK